MSVGARGRTCFAVLWVAAGLALLFGCLGPVDRPTADFTWCPDGRSGGLDYTFSSTTVPVLGQDIVRAVWDFGDGTPPVEALGVANHRYEGPGSYAVVLTVTDRRGVSGTVTKRVAVDLAAFVDPTWTLTLGYPPTGSGVVGNRSDVRLDEVVVRARFYDADGVRLGDGRFVVGDLEPGEHARFEIETREFASRVFFAAVDVESFLAACDPASGPGE
jgi:hypothetical protein